jgi:hypothetical protein
MDEQKQMPDAAFVCPKCGWACTIEECGFVFEDFPSAADPSVHIVSRYRVCPACKHRELLTHNETKVAGRLHYES